MRVKIQTVPGRQIRGRYLPRFHARGRIGFDGEVVNGWCAAGLLADNGPNLGQVDDDWGGFCALRLPDDVEVSGAG